MLHSFKEGLCFLNKKKTKLFTIFMSWLFGICVLIFIVFISFLTMLHWSFPQMSDDYSILSLWIISLALCQACQHSKRHESFVGIPLFYCWVKQCKNTRLQWEKQVNNRKEKVTIRISEILWTDVRHDQKKKNKNKKKE